MPSPQITSFKQLEKVNGHAFSLDTETTGLNAWNNDLIGVSFYCEELDIGGYIPTLDDHEISIARGICQEMSAESAILFHNAKFDLHFLRMNPKKMGFTLMDTTIMIHLLDSRNKKAMAIAEKQFLGSESKRHLVTVAPVRAKIWDWPLDTVADYASNDAKVTWQLGQTLWPGIKEWGLEDLFWENMNYLKVLYDIEDYGILTDETFVRKSAGQLQDHLNVMEQDLKDATGREFNWRSPQQLSAAIYGGLGIAKPKNPFADADGVDRSRFAMGGAYKSSCTSTFLLTEKVHHPLGELISSMRECDKLKKNFEKWLELMDENRVLHTSFNLTGTRTGRLSSSKPNLQNVASNTRGRFTQSVYSGSLERTDEFNMRRALIPRYGHCFVSVDYRQMEMRMFGILSQDPFMLDALIAGKDVHLEIALKVWGDCGYDVNMVHREWSKTITFGLIYGMTLGSLQYKLNMQRYEAQKVTDQYWSQFPRIKPWMDEIVQSCMTGGYLRYWSGRIWKEEDRLDMYKGVNALIQGGCADLLSIAAIRVHDWTVQQTSHHIVNLVHDEIITEVPLDDILRSSRFISKTMQVPDIFNVPFATEVKIGYNYGDMEKMDKAILADESVSSISIEEVFESALKKKKDIATEEERRKHPLTEEHFDDEEESNFAEEELTE